MPFCMNGFISLSCLSVCVFVCMFGGGALAEDCSPADHSEHTELIFSPVSDLGDVGSSVCVSSHRGLYSVSHEGSGRDGKVAQSKSNRNSFICVVPQGCYYTIQRERAFEVLHVLSELSFILKADNYY